MIIPKNEKRKFKVGKMSNKIKYCLIRNKELTKTQVCVNVNVGSAMDPLDNMGLAHFLEHMLFLGSKKYSVENFFDKHVKKHGGYTNAYTSTFETVYFFECNNDGIDLAIDCFSEFFKEPLFNKNCVKREINAINSEHEKNLNNKIFRIRHHLFSLSENPILSKFYTGNLKSFGKNVREAMITFYNKYYLSENITICIQSSLELEEMENLLNPFSTISRKRFSGYNFSFKKPLLKKNNYYSILEAAENINEVVFYFEIKYPKDIFKSLADKIVYDIINDTSENSFSQFLIKKNLVSQLYSFSLEEGIFCIFMETFNTNDDTIKKLINYTNKFFKYLKKLDWNNIINFSRSSYNIFFDKSESYQGIGITNFITSNLHKYDTKYFYSGENIIFADNDTINKDINKILTSFKNHKIIIYTKNNSEWKSKDKYYKMKYTLGKYPSKLPDDSLTKINYIIPKISDPQVKKTKNLFKPIKYNNMYYITNYSFKEPLIYGTVFYNIPDEMIDDVNKMVKLEMFVNYINNIKSIKLSNHIKLGNDVIMKLNIFDKKITITFHAYNNMFLKLYTDFQNLIKNLKKIDKNIFQKVKRNLIDSYIINKSETPWKRMNYYIHNKLVNDIFTNDQILSSLSKVNNISLINLFTLENYLYIVGNFNEKILHVLDQRFIHTIKKYNNKKMLNLKGLSKIDTFKYNKATLYCLQYQYHIGKYNSTNNTLLLLLTNLLDSIFFKKFRTEKQYGYLVGLFTSTVSINSNKEYYFTMKVQTSKNIKNLEKDINDFVDNIINVIKSTNIKPYILSLIKSFYENLKNTSELYGNFHNEVLNSTFNFNKKEEYIKSLKNIKKSDLIKFVKKFITSNKNPIIFLLKNKN